MNRNVARGRAAKTAGDSFEAWVDAQHEMAKILGVLVHVAHNEPKARYVGGRLIYTARSGTDYSGVLADGKAYAAEAKSTKSRLMRSAINKKQVEQLDAVARAGGAAYLLVEFRHGTRMRRYAAPWDRIEWKKLRTAESIGPEDLLAVWSIPPNECYLKRGVQAPVVSSGRKRVFHHE